MRLLKIIPLLFVSAVFSSQLLANEKGRVIRTSKVYFDASGLSPVVGEIESGTEVDILESRSGWKLVFYADGSLTGWVRRYQIRSGFTGVTGTNKQSDSGGFISGLAAISRGVSSFFDSDDDSASSAATATLGVRGRSSVVTLGVRGLSESDLKAAKPNQEELKKMKMFASTASRVDSFAVVGKLQVRDVEPLK